MGDVLALRHVPFEDLGLLEPMLADRRHRVATLDVPVADVASLDLLAPDLLVVLGGPIGAYEDDRYPFLAAEVAGVRARLERGRPTLGLCLGAQIMARALGARVYPGPVKEIGWAPLTLSDAGRASCLRHLDGVEVLHWHGDTFDLPDGAVRLASTAPFPNQAFAVGDALLALQFHAEACGPPLERWLVGHAHEIAHTEGVSVPALRADTARCSPALEAAGRRCFGAWLDALGL